MVPRPAAPPPAPSPRPPWWQPTLVALIALAISGIIPVLLGGEILGIWRITIPNGIIQPIAPTATPSPAITPTPKKGHISSSPAWVLIHADAQTAAQA
jgi:hypothetical protein